MPSANPIDKPSDSPEIYDSYLVAFHDAFRPEISAAIQRYRAFQCGRILDIPCGDGFYSALLAQQLTGGEIVAADLSDAYLERARETLGRVTTGARVSVQQADVYHLPFESESFDLVWCAQSMISLDDPVGALREMRRVLRPRGVLAVLETDEFHHILMPWPLSLEMAIQRAVRTACRRRYGSASKFAQARKLRSAFFEAGLKPTRKTTITADREPPFEDATRTFLLEHFRYLRRFVAMDLTPAESEMLEHFTAVDGEKSFLVSPESEMTCLMTICHARK